VCLAPPHACARAAADALSCCDLTLAGPPRTNWTASLAGKGTPCPDDHDHAGHDHAGHDHAGHDHGGNGTTARGAGAALASGNASVAGAGASRRSGARAVGAPVGGLLWAAAAGALAAAVLL
jgi:hypothetical protein